MFRARSRQFCERNSEFNKERRPDCGGDCGADGDAGCGAPTAAVVLSTAGEVFGAAGFVAAADEGGAATAAAGFSGRKRSNALVPSADAAPALRMVVYLQHRTLRDDPHERRRRTDGFAEDVRTPIGLEQFETPCLLLGGAQRQPPDQRRSVEFSFRRRHRTLYSDGEFRPRRNQGIPGRLTRERQSRVDRLAIEVENAVEQKFGTALPLQFCIAQVNLPGGDGQFRFALRHREPAAVHGRAHGGLDFRCVDRAALIGQADRGIERRRIDPGKLRTAEHNRPAAMKGADDGFGALALALALKLCGQDAVNGIVVRHNERGRVRARKLDIAVRGECLRIAAEREPRR